MTPTAKQDATKTLTNVRRRVDTAEAVEVSVVVWAILVCSVRFEINRALQRWVVRDVE